MYNIIGDVHGCLPELYGLLNRLGYEWEWNPVHERFDYFSAYDCGPVKQLIFVGDFTDRGPRNLETLIQVKALVEQGFAQAVCGNHDDKLLRYCKGNRVKLNNGLDITVDEIEKANYPKDKIINFIGKLPYYLIFDEGRLVVAHAGWKKSLMECGIYSNKCRNWCLYGPVNSIGPDGFPDRIDWAAEREESEPIIVYGHQTHDEVYIMNGAYCIDTSCVFGEKLTALKYPSMKIVQYDALKQYC